MRRLAFVSITLGLLSISAGAADPWTLGAAAGGGWYRQGTITNATGSVQAGVGAQAAAGVVVGDDAYRYLGGEFRYVYRSGDLQLKSQSQTASMAGDAHVLAYDLMIHATPRNSRFRPFVAGGGGMKLYRGTGKEQAFQPLSSFGYLTQTRQTEPAVSFGGGVKCRLSRHAQFRVDFRDYVTPFPNKVLTPAPGAKAHGWLHDFVPLAGLSYVF